MKKILMIRLIVLSTASLFFSSSYSQFAAERIAGLDKQSQSSSSKSFATGKDADKMALESLKAVSGKMFKHFSRNYKNATDILVRPVDENTSIAFKIDGVSNRVQYNKKGKWQYSIRSYEESKLSESLRNAIESNYPGFIVFGFVAEVQVLNKTATLVMIENKTSWKRIRIIDDEMDVYESYTKSSK